ncbi:MAG: hypothetical protein IMW89_00370 [Ktedonobacteraceae bacterium]|nr:hypothetical protein [Ktedonobacteraceae bacterium]
MPQISQPMPPGYVMVPQEALEKMKARPSASGQGCLWGLVQGVLSGVLVAFTTHSSYFYLGLLMGFFFYILAGFITTRRGGSFLRGGWAGMWAGIISTISFWLVYGLCYLILLVQAMQQISDRGLRIPPDKAVEFAARSIHTALPSVTASGSSSQSLSNFLILVGAGLLLAWFLGVMGGLLGSARFKARLARMQQKISQQAASP